MSLNRGIGSVEYMKKRIPKNSKYDHIKTRLDTGCSLSKYMERLEDIRKNYRYRKDEIFKRLKVSTFAQLILQVASVSDGNDRETICESNDGASVVSEVDLESLPEQAEGSPHSEGSGRDVCHSTRSTLLSVISGVGELNIDQVNQMIQNESSPRPSPVDNPYPDCPYLLLDVRDREQYDSCHIISAHNFPITMLSRTMNPYTKEVLNYKNAEGKIIILYDEDERMASQAATLMCERGFENLFMLSGGLKVIAQKFPTGMTTGSLPASCLYSCTPLKGKKFSGTPAITQVAEKRWRFTTDELSQVQKQLDKIVPSSTNSRLSSRTSENGSQSKTPSQDSNSSTRRDSKPWK